MCLKKYRKRMSFVYVVQGRKKYFVQQSKSYSNDKTGLYVVIFFQLLWQVFKGSLCISIFKALQRLKNKILTLSTVVYNDSYNQKGLSFTEKKLSESWHYLMVKEWIGVFSRASSLIWLVAKAGELACRHWGGHTKSWPALPAPSGMWIKFSFMVALSFKN